MTNVCCHSPQWERQLNKSLDDCECKIKTSDVMLCNIMQNNVM